MTWFQKLKIKLAFLFLGDVEPMGVEVQKPTPLPSLPDETKIKNEIENKKICLEYALSFGEKNVFERANSYYNFITSKKVSCKKVHLSVVKNNPK